MTIDKAIVVLSCSAYGGMTTHGLEFKDALKLGIEALKREREYRLTRGLRTFDLLPGETGE
jgi:hypothetical protein